MLAVRCERLFTNGRFRKSCVRHISKYLHKDRLSKSVRQRFLDFFINENSHHFIRSSPVIPYCDSSLAFVNAGMNQFKGVLLGTQSPLYKKVANSQKCIRVGGKHNDLKVVGGDGYHHTFFEMLGNWSFGAYNKREAMELAWTLLTQVYKINKNSFYVTYFKGDSALDIPGDVECKETWRSLGVKEDRILGFGLEDNFWEMGTTGPCGPCTEIHIDMRGPTNRAKFVNKGLHDLTEIWNIVFIHYNRREDGELEKLRKLHIDTGMGFERLCAVMQKKLSNYDTDLFTPIFSAIPKICKNVAPYNGAFGEKDWNNLNTSYRVLADHTRMLTVCLADGMIPETSQKLRRIMRKAFLLSDTVFKNDQGGLVKELSNYVVDILGDAYPEMGKNVHLVHQIIDYEEDLYKFLRSTSSAEWKAITEKEPELADLDILETPGLLAAYKNIKASNLKEISPQYGFKLYDTYGLDEESIVKLAEGLKLSIQIGRFRELFNAMKTRNKLAANNEMEELWKKLEMFQLTPTNDHFKYKYTNVNNTYIFHGVEARVLLIIKDGEFVNVIEPNHECIVVFDKTPLYCEAGGQSHDKGYAVYNDGVFEISVVENLNGRILHKGTFKSTRKLGVGETLKINVDEERRLRNMRNHTATHLLNCTLKKVKGATCQKSSKVAENSLSFDVGIFGDKITIEDIKEIEKHINGIIKEGVNVKTSDIDSQELLSHDNITLVPGESYPETGIRFVEIIGKDLTSREPCCGTHVLNTADIIDFCIVSCKSLGRSTISIQAVTGYKAKVVREQGVQIIDDINKIKKNMDDNIDKPEIFDGELITIRKRLQVAPDSEKALPLTIANYCNKELEEINKKVKTATRCTLKEFIEMEMKTVIDSKMLTSNSNKEFIVHYLRSSMILELIPLQKATKLCSQIPVLVISYADNMVKARCCVPETMRSQDFNAYKWLNKVSMIFKSTAQAPKGQDPGLVCNMKAKHVNIQEWDTLLKESLNIATIFAKDNL